MGRLLIALLVLAGPVQAWEFTPVPVCTLANDGPTPVELTYDPRVAEPYSITVVSDAPWPTAGVFGIRFDGPRALTIRTTRYRLSDAGRRLTVTDRGFGNVLDGLQFNEAATAFVGETAHRFSLADVAPAIDAFRACTAAPLA